MTTPTGPSAPSGPAVDREVAERLRLRYPPPLVSKKIKTTLVLTCVIIALTWLIWAALVHARPAAAAQISAFDITSDTSMKIEVLVQRRDPGQPAICRVLAQSTDFQPVAEIEITAPPSRFDVTSVEVTLKTLRRATSAKVTGCRVPG